MSGLIGVALVVDDISKGCNLAFRYPAPPAENASHFHKLSPSLLAKLFRPKSALCNQSFELSMDDLRFISHPVLVAPRAAPAAPLSVTAAIAGSSGGSSAPTGVGVASAPLVGSSPATMQPDVKRNETTMFNIIFALEKRPQAQHQHQHQHQQHGQADDLQLQQLRRNIRRFHTVAAQLANGLLHEELRAGFVSTEVRELLHIRDELAQSERGASNGNNGASGSASGGNSGSHHHHHHHHHRSDGGAGASDSGGSTIEVDPQVFIDVALSQSQLANDLKAVYHGLDESGMVHVVINRWVKLSLTLTDAVDVQVQNLRPYHTLLLLADEDKIVDALPADHSRQLRVLIEAVNPLKSFQELALETCIPIHQMFRLAAHLVYWGYGRIIDTITLHNIYQVNASACIGVQSPLSLEFRRKFAPYELSEMLSTFSGSRRIGEYMKTLSSAKKVEYVHMLIWLLQHDFIVQLHRYIYFMIPSDGDYAPESDSFENHSSYRSHRHHRRRLRSSSSGSTSGLGLTPPIDGENPLSPEPRPHGDVPLAQVVNVASQLLFTDQERDYLAKIAKPNPVFALFKRLCVYFHGQHHLEEIMWRENLSRGELRTVMSTYQDIIVCCTHE